ncbi:MAG: hypothetical protein RI893_1301 [Pseudomonadota bacterium]|jgi:hypothetical protein
MTKFSETIQLAPGIYVQASPQNFRLHRLLPWDNAPGPETLAELGETTVTRQLMAGAFYAGLPPRWSDVEITEQLVPSLLRHIYGLATSYPTTHATPPTMRRAAERLMAAGKQAAATHCLQVAEEESGHDTLALLDLEALGLPAQDFVARLQLKTSLALVELFAGYADSEQPIAVLGYAYALERAALFVTEASINAIEQLIPIGINATRCLRVHSSVGSDAGHVAESIAFIATLPPQDRATIVRAVYQTICLQNTSASDYPGDEAMQSLLDEFGWAS